MIEETRRKALALRGVEMQRIRRELTGLAYLGEPDLMPDELERKHVLIYPDSVRRDWMRRRLARWLPEEEE